MEKVKYAEIVAADAFKRTRAGNLKWRVERNYIMASVIGTIEVTIHYYDQGPDSAQWEYASISSPVNRDLTIVGNPREPKAKFCEIQAQGVILDQLNQIFLQVLLDPRAQEFEDAMKKLGGS